MGKSRLVINRNAIADKLYAAASVSLTQRLIEYAKKEILAIGNDIKRYSGGNHMQRTMNLLDSLCWGVSYRGELKGFGFYQEQMATQLSYLHEFSDDYYEYPVGGRVLASNFVRQMGNLRSNGWRVFFAVLAPYWGYWENGFKMSTRGGDRFLKWAVMTQHYDKISGELRPAQMNFSVHVDTSKKWKPRKDTGYGNPRFKKYEDKGYSTSGSLNPKNRRFFFKK